MLFDDYLLARGVVDETVKKPELPMRKFTNFIPSDLVVNCWQDIAPYFEKLKNQHITSCADLESFLIHYSEVLAVYLEQKARVYTQMTCHTHEEKFAHQDEVFNAEIDPQVHSVTHELDQKILNSAYFHELPEKRYGQYKKYLNNQIHLFVEENIPLFSRLSQQASAYEKLAGSLTVQLDQKELSLSQANFYLNSEERAKREQAWRAIRDARFAKRDEFNALFDEMIRLRHDVAKQAGYKNFRDYKHIELKRFDYSIEQILEFHQSIETVILPLAKKIAQKDALQMGTPDDYRPWDLSAPTPGKAPLQPFQNTNELLDKTKKIFYRLHPQFGDNLEKMSAQGLFDLDARPHKAPGGYNYAFEVTGMPFIFMNASGIHDDLVTLMHEGGHAMHTFLTNDEPLLLYRDVPSETAETASMSMELMSSVFWQEFYSSQDTKRARREHLEDIIKFFPWCATVDAFQHWIYLNPHHSHQDRDQYFKTLYDERFQISAHTHWQGLEKYKQNEWQRVSHIFTVPFYYIEYGIAQLGALQIYRRFVENPDKALQGYMAGLKLGASCSIPDVWRAMGIEFDFSQKAIQGLMDFVMQELNKLEVYS